MLIALMIGLLCIIPLSLSNPAINGDARPQTLNINTANMPNSYDFHYEASDGSSRTEEGEILNPGTDQAALDVLGTVRWYDKKGQLYEMTYKAGKRGYRTIIKKVKNY